MSLQPQDIAVDSALIYIASRFVGLYVCGPGYLSRYCNSLRAGRSGDRIPMGAIFSAPARTDSEAHPASYTIGTGCFPGVKRRGRGVDRQPQFNSEVKERVQLYLYSPFGPSWPVMGWSYFRFLYFVYCPVTEYVKRRFGNWIRLRPQTKGCGGIYIAGSDKRAVSYSWHRRNCSKCVKCP
jgi:hypothetical protein